MLRVPGRAGVLGAQLAALLGAATACADDSEPIRVRVSAPPGCTSTEELTAEISARTARPAGPGEAARSFTVTITTSGKKAHGTLTIDEPGRLGAVRDVSGESCAEVATALALVTALAIDPRASTAVRPPPAPPRPRPTTAPPSPPRPPPAHVALPWWGPIGAPLPVLPTAAAPQARVRVAAVLGARAGGATAPGLLPALSGAVDFALAGGAALSPSLRLTLLAGAHEGTAGTGPLRARFRWTAARVDACPLRIPVIGPIVVLPCGLLEGGALRAEGITPFAPLASTRPWLAPGLLARAQAGLFGGLLFEIEGGAVFPLVRDTFYFAPTVPAHEVPASGGFVGGGVGMHFP